MSGSVRHFLTIDFESWVHRFARDAWDSEARRRHDDGYILRAGQMILERLRAHRCRTTFFVVAEIYEWFPQLVERIAAEGHEIAFHGWDHQTLEVPGLLAGQLDRSRGFLERFRPLGFRAPRMVLHDADRRLLPAHGFRYDSSIYHSAAWLGPDAVLHAEAAAREADGLRELPVSCIPLLSPARWPFARWSRSSVSAASFPGDFLSTLARGAIPIGSGLFVGLLGDASLAWIRARDRHGISAHLVMHPWQVVQPPLRLDELWHAPPLVASWPYFVPRAATFERLLSELAIAPLCEALDPTDAIEAP